MKPFTLSRRTLLRAGAGVSIAMPVLEAMLDSKGRWLGLANAAATTPPVRVMTFMFPHGVVLRQWVPTSTGSNYTITNGLAPVAAFQGDFNVVSGLQQTAWLKGPGGGHANGIPNFATAVPSIATGAGGPSFEQVLAAEFGAATKFRALVANNEVAGSQAEGATTAHMNNISWTGPGMPAPAERDPLNFFMTMMSSVPASGPSTAPTAEVQAAMARNKSVLDHALGGSLGTLRLRVGSVDKARIDNHLTGIREVERILTAPATSSSMAAACKAPDPIMGDPQMLIEVGEKARGHVAIPQARAQVFLRLFVTAFACDLTRYASFAMSNGFDDRRFPEFGGGLVGHHQITHDGGEYGAGEDIEMKFVTYYTWLLAYLLDLMKKTPDGAGTLLDNSLVYFGSEMAEGYHTNNNMPVVLAGKAGGKIATGRHLALPAAHATGQAVPGHPHGGRQQDHDVRPGRRRAARRSHHALRRPARDRRRDLGRRLSNGDLATSPQRRRANDVASATSS